jgi:hypothetical protein
MTIRRYVYNESGANLLRFPGMPVLLQEDFTCFLARLNMHRQLYIDC